MLPRCGVVEEAHRKVKLSWKRDKSLPPNGGEERLNLVGTVLVMCCT